MKPVVLAVTLPTTAALAWLLLPPRSLDPQETLAHEPSIQAVVDPKGEEPGLRPPPAPVTSKTRAAGKAVELRSAGAAPEGQPTPERARLLSGELTESEYGPGYFSAIKAIASEHAVENIRSNIEERAASYCGFGSQDELLECIGGEGELAPDLVPQLERLYATSLGIADRIDSYVTADFEAGVAVESWATGEDVDHRAWEADYLIQEKGLLMMSISTGVGPRQFVLHFNSYNHPVLENDLQQLQNEKDAFWRAAKGS